MEDIGYTKTDLGDASKQTMDSFVRTLVRAMFMHDAISSVLAVQLEGTEQSECPVVELEIRLRSINGQEIKLEDDDNGS